MAAPDPNVIVDQATAMTYRADTPGLNTVLAAWSALEDFCGNWASSTYAGLAVVTGLIGDLVT